VSSPANFDQKLELRDASGRTVGFVLPERQLLDLLAQQEALQKQVVELRQQVAALTARAEEVARERDAYLQTLHFLSRDRLVPITEEELEDIRKTGIPFEQIVAEVEQIVTRGSSGA
jgi:hypothetical protein